MGTFICLPPSTDRWAQGRLRRPETDSQPRRPAINASELRPPKARPTGTDRGPFVWSEVAR
jgi:hypothetical protein